MLRMTQVRVAIYFTVLLSGLIVPGPAVAQTIVEPEAPASASPSPAPEASVSPPSTPTVDDNIRALNAVDTTARIEAVRSLGQLRDARAVPALARSLQSDPSPEVRGWIIRTLDQFGTQEAHAAIVVAARGDADERVRALALHLAPEAAPAAPTSPTYDSPQREAASAYQPYRPQRRRRDPVRSFKLAGWLSFGISYFCNVIIGSVFIFEEENYGWPAFIPVIGPVVVAGYAFDSAWSEDVIVAAMNILWFTAQSAGLAMAIYGHVLGRRQRQERSSSRFNISVVPSGPGGPGVTLGGSF